jgi:DNA-binding NarL/FixJ family response regulator
VTYERRCLVVDDQPLVRLGVRRLLADTFEVDEAEDGEGALRMVSDVEDFDVAIVDTGRRTSGDSKVAGTRIIKAMLEARPGLGIVAHCDTPERYGAVEAMRAGARAYVSKRSSADELTRAVEAAADADTFVDPAAAPGGDRTNSPLTRRQRQILQLFADGHSTDRAARALGLSPETVRTHAKAVLARLSARDRAHAVAIALRGGLIE